MTATPKSPNTISKALRDASRGQNCTLAIVSTCRRDPEYTIGAHLRFVAGAGAAEKPDDIFIIDACDACHAVLDDYSRWARAGLTDFDVFHAFATTLKRRRHAGLITLKGERR